MGEQHGFRSGRSILTCITVFCNYILYDKFLMIIHKLKDNTWIFQMVFDHIDQNWFLRSVLVMVLFFCWK